MRFSVPALIEWLDVRVVTDKLSLTTANCYRRWLASYFDALGHPEASLIRNWIPPGSPEARLRVDQADAVSLAEATPTDKRLLKSLTDLDDIPGNSRYLSYIDGVSLQALIEQLLAVTASGKPRYTAGPAAALMFSVTLLTGLRPNEWVTARYRESHFDPDSKLTLGPVLEVKTLKQTNRREDNPLRETRYLLLDEWPQDQLDRLKVLLIQIQGSLEPDGQAAAEAEASFDAYYNKARMTLGRAWKRVQKKLSAAVSPDSTGSPSPERKATGAGSPQSSNDLLTRSVSFYTARHTFAEEVRRKNTFTRFELAAMLGHSLLTNQVYYGPRSGDVPREFDFVLPRPWPGDAEQIEKWDYKVNPLRTDYMQNDLFGGMASESLGAVDERAQIAEREEKDGVSSFFLR